MKYLYILFILISTNISSQNDSIVCVVKYTLNLSLGLPAQNQSKLIFNTNNSCYIEGVFNIEKKSDNSQEYKTHGDNRDVIKYYVDVNKGELHKKDEINKEIYLVKEKLSKINWQISSQEQDTVLGQLCHKVIGDFRGRTYTVWFAPNIAVRFGPWKIQGLPGLILKAKDNDNQVDFTAISIEYKNSKKLMNELHLPKEFKKTILLEEYVSLIKQRDLENFQMIMATMPRSNKISNITINDDRKSRLEMKYEWEEEKEDK